MNFMRIEEIGAKNATSNFTDALNDVARAQAEISFKAGYEQARIEDNEILLTATTETHKAGIKEVADFVNDNIPQTLGNYIGFWQKWQRKLKEWGI